MSTSDLSKAASVSVGDTLAGKYRVERILGMGGMGVVVAAKHLDLHEIRAVKLMHTACLGNRQAVERFLREARAAVRLRSEHVAEVHDVGRLESGAPYIVMELLHGEDLSALMKQQGTFPIEEAVLYISQACHAVAEAHVAGIVHRDLKPANLFLIRRDDGSPCIKVLDFGISKTLPTGGEPAENEMTGTRDVMGTPLYMSPEQMRSARTVDARADVWSLGAILYKLLTGRAPFQAPTTPEVFFATLDDRPVRPPSALRPDIPPALERIILRCLDKDSTRRYSCAAELLAALRPFGLCAGSPEDDGEATLLRPNGQALSTPLPMAPAAGAYEQAPLEKTASTEPTPPGAFSSSPRSTTATTPLSSSGRMAFATTIPFTAPPPSPRPSFVDAFPPGFRLQPPPMPSRAFNSVDVTPPSPRPSAPTYPSVQVPRPDLRSLSTVIREVCLEIANAWRAALQKYPRACVALVALGVACILVLLIAILRPAPTVRGPAADSGIARFVSSIIFQPPVPPSPSKTFPPPPEGLPAEAPMPSSTPKEGPAEVIENEPKKPKWSQPMAPHTKITPPWEPPGSATQGKVTPSSSPPGKTKPTKRLWPAGI